MDRETLGIVAFPFLFLLLAFRVPIGLAMLLVGSAGTAMIAGWLPIFSQVKTSAWHLFSNYSLSVIPLFLLMGNLASRAGMSEALFKFASACLGHRKGGVAMAAVGACAGFGAICGSSLATAATMGKVALPELRRLGYSGSLSTGALAAGGTLGILIPPSVILIIYSILTEQNIAKMFLAALVPGILAALGYIVTIAIFVRLVPGSGRAQQRITMAGRMSYFRNIWHVLLIFTFMLSGIYLGWFTPTEGAAVGAAGTGLVAMFQKNFDLSALLDVIQSTAITSGKVRKIANANRMDEFRDGEVLVATMTDPTYEPIMKKSAAIITEKGGRTSHAAIVARELGIPAVIGTGNARRVLGTGDMVTVDTSSGVVGRVYSGKITWKEKNWHVVCM